MNLDNISLEDKVGQLFMVGFDGHESNTDILNLIDKYNVSGVCYFSRNLKNPKQVHKLSTTLQNKAKKGFPLLLTIDQEGGMVNRLTEGITISPSNMALGALNNRVYTKQISEIIAKELRAMGVNMNFSPALDVNNNANNPVIGVRSFGETPNLVSVHGNEIVQAYQKENIAPSVKHFPGHGDTDVDSHLDLPVVDHPTERLEEVELAPFKYVIDRGVDSIMVSHVSFPTLENKYPATLSHNIITGLLREKLGYDGVVVTDCMEMLAIDNNYTSAESAILAINAGIDLVLVSHTYDKQRAAMDGVIEAVRSGEITEERIDQSVRRVLALKARRNVGEEIVYNPDNFQSKRSVEFERKVHEQAITVVKNENTLLPLSDTKKTVLLWPKIEKTSLVDEEFKQSITLSDYLGDKITDYQELSLSLDDSVIHACEAADQIIIVTYNLLQSVENLALTKGIVERFAEKTVACAFRNPYDLKEIPTVAAYVAAYDIRPLTLESTAKVLTGEVKSAGKLSVTINENYKIGTSAKL